jgi:hypothetical protein
MQRQILQSGSTTQPKRFKNLTGWVVHTFPILLF